MAYIVIFMIWFQRYVVFAALYSKLLQLINFPFGIAAPI